MIARFEIHSSLQYIMQHQYLELTKFTYLQSTQAVHSKPYIAYHPSQHGPTYPLHHVHPYQPPSIMQQAYASSPYSRSYLPLPSNAHQQPHHNRAHSPYLTSQVSMQQQDAEQLHAPGTQPSSNISPHADNLSPPGVSSIDRRIT